MKERLLKLVAICCLLLLGMTNVNAQCEDCFDSVIDPVCVETENGDIIPYPNACFAECEGFGEDAIVECEDNGGEWPEDDCDCEFEFDPVCVVTVEGDTIPFPNACFAECEGFGEDAIVECPDYEGEWPGNDCDCELEGEEVCVLTANDLICVFPNMCFAECAGYGEEDLVECEDEPTYPEDDCDCDFEFDPICIVTPEGDTIPFPSACLAECAGFGEDAIVDCPDYEEEWPENDCDCELEGEEVCVLTDEDLICVFPNMCFAECAGYGEDNVVECEENGGGEWPEDDCDCDWDEFELVCVLTPEGDIIPFPSACFAECAGFGEEDLVDCEDNGGEWPEDDCDCELEGEEVCVLTAEDLICVFPNMCYAECAGYGEEDVVECEENGGEWPGDDCDCEFEFDPVCVVTPEGDIIPFPNACFAECEGYGEDAIVDCEENEEEWPEDDCDCDFEGEEVCVTIEDEFVLSFPNACWAECAGFSTEDIEECDGFTGENDPIELAPFLFTNSENNPSGLSGEDVSNLVDQVVSSQTTSIEGASIYPNPINGNNLTIELEMLEESVANITIVSITGQTVQQLKVNAVKGKQQIDVNLNELTNGVYLAKIETANNMHSIKFIKQ